MAICGYRWGGQGLTGAGSGLGACAQAEDQDGDEVVVLGDDRPSKRPVQGGGSLETSAQI